jgi:subtilisin family serine protease
MTVEAGPGDFLWRGGRRIRLEKEREFITFMLAGPEELEAVSAIEGVVEVEPVVDRVFKARVRQGRRDEVMEEVRADERHIVTHHAYHPEDDAATRYYLTDQINAKFKEGVPTARIDAIVHGVKLRVLRHYPGQSGTTLLLQVTDDTGMNPIKAANLLAEMEEVEYAEPNLINRYLTSHTPSDPLFQQQWHLRSWDGPQVVSDADVSAEAAWDITRGERSVVVAIIDDGFDLSHPDFTGVGKVVYPKDYVDGDSNPFPETAAGDYHGTPVAGVAIAEENGVGTVGIAPGCAFLPVRFPLTASDDLLWEIFDFVARHADVVSCSWGPPPVFAPLSQLMHDKFQELSVSGGPRKKGCLIFFAAGNYNAPLDDPSNTGFAWRHPKQGLLNTTGRILSGEAAHPQTVAVSASTSQNRKAAYSSWGAEVTLCAPSNNFHPLNPQQFVPGLGITTTDNEQHGQGFTPNSRYTARFGGTSSATPLAAGVAALVISANPQLTAVQVRQILQDTADKIEDSQPDIVLGHTKGTYDQNGHSEWFGHGRVNAAAAVQRAMDMLPADAARTLTVSAAAEDELVGDGDSDLYRVTVGSRMTVTVDGPAGEDFDLYVKRDGIPSETDYDARGFGPTANESLVIEPLPPGDYRILVRSYRGSGQYQLKVEVD